MSIPQVDQAHVQRSSIEQEETFLETLDVMFIEKWEGIKFPHLIRNNKSDHPSSMMLEGVILLVLGIFETVIAPFYIVASIYRIGDRNTSCTEHAFRIFFSLALPPIHLMMGAVWLAKAILDIPYEMARVYLESDETASRKLGR